MNIKGEFEMRTLLVKGDRKCPSRKLLIFKDKVALVDEVLEIPVTLYYEKKKKKFQDKIVSF